MNLEIIVGVAHVSGLANMLKDHLLEDQTLVKIDVTKRHLEDLIFFNTQELERLKAQLRPE